MSIITRIGAILLFVIGNMQQLHAQILDSNKANIPRLQNQLKINFSNNLGVQWEQHLKNRKVSLVFFGGWSLGKQSNNYRNTNDVPIIASPDIFIEYRHYYNLDKRFQKGYNTYHNAGEFLFGRVESIFRVQGQNSFSMLGIQGWGTQRSISRTLQAGLQAGIIEHFFFDKPVTGGFNYVALEPMLSVSISFAFKY
jgi:hypothetical protein